MILTTTNSIEGFKIFEYKGIVSGVSVNVQLMKMTFNMEKYYKALSESIAVVKEQAFRQFQDNAKALNANAIVGHQSRYRINFNELYDGIRNRNCRFSGLKNLSFIYHYCFYESVLNN